MIILTRCDNILEVDDRAIYKRHSLVVSVVSVVVVAIVMVWSDRRRCVIELIK